MLTKEQIEAHRLYLRRAFERLGRKGADPMNEALCDTALKALQPEGADSKDAARYRWLKDRYMGADFGHSAIDAGAGWALIFHMPEESTVSADLDRTVDDAARTPQLPQATAPAAIGRPLCDECGTYHFSSEHHGSGDAALGEER